MSKSGNNTKLSTDALVNSISKSGIAKLINHERLCKLEKNNYLVCRDYCCGEFWESRGAFCCDNNFKPTRNLFFYLLICFVTLIVTIIAYLLVENTLKDFAIHSLQTDGLEHSSYAHLEGFSGGTGTSNEEDSSIGTSLVSVTASDKKTDGKMKKRWSCHEHKNFKNLSNTNLPIKNTSKLPDKINLQRNNESSAQKKQIS